MNPIDPIHLPDRPVLSRRALLLAPITLTAFSTAATAVVRHTRVASVADFGAALGFLGQRHPNVLVYVSARWCPICRTIDATLLTSARVRQALRDVPLLEVDVTAMSPQARALMQLVAAEGPPTLFVVDARARAERPGTRLVGVFTEAVLLERLRPFTG